MSLDAYLDAYDAAHRNRWNKFTHAIGIPLIVASLVVVFFAWPWAIALFVVGWIFQFIGHACEGNSPKFLQGPVFLLIGPLWVLLEVLAALGLYKRHPTISS